MMLTFLLTLELLHSSMEDHHSLEDFFKGLDYDKRMPPPLKGGPLHVKNQVFVLKLAKINEHDFTYEISYFIRQWWTDTRLASNDSSKMIIYHRPPDELIWVPNLILLNSDKNEKVEGNVATHIDYQGNIFVSQRMKAKCSCIMDLSFYPMDTQYCPFLLESYAYSVKEVRLDWQAKPVDFDQDEVQLSGYYLVDTISEKVQKRYRVQNSTEDHDNLILKFVVKRTFLYYLYRAYIPIMLLMVFNIGSYWVPDTALPARVTLIVTTFLTNTFILQSVSEATVRVSTTTSLQLFTIFNIILIVVAIVEYFFVLHLKSKEMMKVNTQPHDGKVTNSIRLSAITSTPSDTKKAVETKPPTDDVHQLDKIFRIMTPIIYSAFCCVYFAYYLGHTPSKR